MALTIDQQNTASHLPALQAAVERTTGPMIEVGAGAWSTVYLARAAFAMRRTLVTVEHSPEWRPRPEHQYHLVTDSLVDAVAMHEHFGVALIDGPASERAEALRMLLPKTDYIVIHDTEALADYPGLAAWLNEARYRRDFPVPTTTIVSVLRPWE